MWDMPVPKKGDKNYKLVKGDILISNATSAFGLTGHAGIAISSTQVLHIANKNSKPAVMSLNKWIARYGTEYNPGLSVTWVYRHSNRTVANQAGNWARDNYRGKQYSYGITTGIYSKNPTYCSKIVWQAYHYGPSGASFMKVPLLRIVQPYQLPTYFKKGNIPAYHTAI